jgi:prophage tail gpP-like protein
VSDLVLKINDIEYRRFDDVAITISMDSISGSFGVSVMNFFKGGSSAKDIKMGQSIIVEIDKQPVINGYVERMPVRYGKGFERMDIIGRDVTCDLIDCSFDFTPNEWKNQTVGNLIKNLCTPFGISVVIDSSVIAQANTVVESFKATEGETVFEQIAELCRDHAIIPLSLADGKLTLTKATTDKYTTDGLIQGVNIIGGYLDQSNDNRFSSTKVKGYGIGTDNKSVADYVSCMGSFSDSVITRTRPTVIFAETLTNTKQCQNKAKFEARRRAGFSRIEDINVSGWTQSDGKIWDINKLVNVDDYYTGYKQAMLINNVRFIFNERGEITTLSVVDKDTYNLSDNSINIKSKYD